MSLTNTKLCTSPNLTRLPCCLGLIFFFLVKVFRRAEVEEGAWSGAEYLKRNHLQRSKKANIIELCLSTQNTIPIQTAGYQTLGISIAQLLTG